MHMTLYSLIITCTFQPAQRGTVGAHGTVFTDHSLFISACPERCSGCIWHFIISWGDNGLVVKSLMKQEYGEGNNKAFITPEVDNTFQPIRIGYCHHMTKTNNMAMCLALCLAMCRRRFPTHDYSSQKNISRVIF